MPIILPPQTQIDRTRAGRLRISAPIIGDLLVFPKTMAVETSVFHPWDIEVIVLGEGMPLIPESGIPEDVSIVCRVGQKDGRRTIFARWKHAPDKEWIATERPGSMPSSAGGPA